MATSESDDFESADEEMSHDKPAKRSTQQWCSSAAIDSESDDDTEYIPRMPYANMICDRKMGRYSSEASMMTSEKKPRRNTIKENKDIVEETCNNAEDKQSITNTTENSEETKEEITDTRFADVKLNESEEKTSLKKNKIGVRAMSKSTEEDRTLQKLGPKKLGMKLTQSNARTTDTADITGEISKIDVLPREEIIFCNESFMTNELTELDVPEEMLSNKKFKEVFKPEGWEGLGNEIELPEELTEEKLQPILKRLSLAGEEAQNSSGGWGWGTWGVNSLINTASAGVSTLTSHVSHGLTLLEESITISEELKVTEMEGEENSVTNENKAEESPEEQQSFFGFGNFISGVSSITKLVESTGSKVMTGGLDTLEAIGKKTMEVLQEGDPGLKKKRALFTNETDGPSLSQILQESKERAESIEKTIEEKQQMRKVHFESLFDDYQGLVHLEALEMLSKQSTIKIQQRLMSLDTVELNSVEETLEEVKELCDLDEDDEKESDVLEDDLRSRLQDASNNLGISITFTNFFKIWEDSKTYLTPPVRHNDQEVLEQAVSVLAKFTAFSVERFHKIAELLLIKEHRTTVDEADTLVLLAHIFSNQTGILANDYCHALKVFSETSDKPNDVNGSITTIYMKASKASSYIQDAFRLLIPTIQVGAI